VADGNFVVVDRSDGRQQIIAEVDYSAPPRSPCTKARSTWCRDARIRSSGSTGTGARPTSPARTSTTTPMHRLHQAQGAGRASTACAPAPAIASTAKCTWCGVSPATRRSATTRHENIGYGPVNLPDQELHTTAVWWQLPQATLARVRLAPGRAGRLPRRRRMRCTGRHGGGDGRRARSAEGRGQRRWRLVRARRPRAAAASCAARGRRGAWNDARASCRPFSLRQLPRRRRPERTACSSVRPNCCDWRVHCWRNAIAAPAVRPASGRCWRRPKSTARPTHRKRWRRACCNASRPARHECAGAAIGRVATAGGDRPPSPAGGRGLG
jgi:hypothetical protein